MNTIMQVLYLEDFRKNIQRVNNKSIDLVILHPPYIEKDDEFLKLGYQAIDFSINKLKNNSPIVIIQHDIKRIGALPRYSYLLLYAISKGLNCYDQKIWWYQESRNLIRKNYAYIGILSNGKPTRPSGKEDYHDEIWFIKDNMRREDFRDAFHDEIPKRLISAFTKEGDTILDLFAGTSTTLKVAKSMNRNCIGFEKGKDLKKYWEGETIDE